MEKRWTKRNSLSTLESVVLKNYGHKTIDELLNPKKDPYLCHLKKCVCRLRKAKDETVVIIADYDCDGVVSGGVLERGLKEYGVKSVHVRYPKRLSEGYGISMNIVDEIAEKYGKCLIITVDNGIAAREVIDHAKAKGMEVIVTDHHLPRDDKKLPKVEIILDPKATDRSEFKEYCGAGLAWRIVKELIPEKQEVLKDLLVLVSIATVADVVPLVGDNRNIVKEGLELINARHTTKGMLALLGQIGQEHIDETSYGFSIAPIINAAGRLYDDGPQMVHDLIFATEADPDLPKKAKELIEHNEKRKEMEKEFMKIAGEQLENVEIENCIVLYHKDFHEGLVGIIAGRLAESYGVPAIVFTDASAPGKLKGSGRTASGIHLKASLDAVNEHIFRYGGHAGAAGLTIEKDNLDTFRDALNRYLEGKVTEETKSTLPYDLEIEVEDIPTMENELERFAPFGEGNPRPIFRIRNFQTEILGGSFYRTMGKEGEHVKLMNKTACALGFGMANRFEQDGCPRKIEILGTLSKNVFNGYKNDQIEIMDYKAEKENFELQDILKDLLSF